MANNPINWVDPWGLQRFVTGPNGQPVPILYDPGTGRWGFPDMYTDPFTQSTRDAIKKCGETADAVSDELSKVPPNPVTGWPSFFYNLYFLVRGYWTEYIQPYMGQYYKK